MVWLEEDGFHCHATEVWWDTIVLKKIPCFCTSNVRLRYSCASQLPSSKVQPMVKGATSTTSKFGNSPGEKMVVPVIAQLCSRAVGEFRTWIKRHTRQLQVKSRGSFLTLLPWRWYSSTATASLPLDQAVHYGFPSVWRRAPGQQAQQDGTLITLVGLYSHGVDLPSQVLCHRKQT